MTRRQRIDPENPDIQVIQEVAALIIEGKIVVLPTDTAYGLTGNPSNANVVQRILAVKERTEKLGMPLLAENLAQAQDLVTLPPLAVAVASRFWPGAVTIIVPSRHMFPPGITGPQESLAIRVPNHRVTLEVIRATGFPIIGTSANKSDLPSPRTADAAENQLGDQVDYILDAGPTQQTSDSTIVNFTIKPPEIIREGAVSQSDLESVMLEEHED